MATGYIRLSASLIFICAYVFLSVSSCVWYTPINDPLHAQYMAASLAKNQSRSHGDCLDLDVGIAAACTAVVADTAADVVVASCWQARVWQPSPDCREIGLQHRH